MIKKKIDNRNTCTWNIGVGGSGRKRENISLLCMGTNGSTRTFVRQDALKYYFHGP